MNPEKMFQFKQKTSFKYLLNLAELAYPKFEFTVQQIFCKYVYILH